jgi:hypothetical protein
MNLTLTCRVLILFGMFLPSLFAMWFYGVLTVHPFGHFSAGIELLSFPVNR